MLPQKLTIALLSGGNSSERKISLASGIAVEQALDKKKFIIKKYDPAKDLPRLVLDCKKIDIAFLALHGSGGEDGVIQGFLESLNIPYTGSGVRSSALAMDKILSRQIYQNAGLNIAPAQTLKRGEKINLTQLKKLGFPLIIKPATEGSSIGIEIVQSSATLQHALKKVLLLSEKILIEKFLKGVEITVGVLEKSNKKLIALPPVEIVPKRKFFDLQAKYDPKLCDEICPARLSKQLIAQAQELALKAHEALDCRGVSRTDMILIKNKFFLLETNTLPGLTKNSLLPKAAQVYGLSFSELCEQLIKTALDN